MSLTTTGNVITVVYEPEVAFLNDYSDPNLNFVFKGGELTVSRSVSEQMFIANPNPTPGVKNVTNPFEKEFMGDLEDKLIEGRDAAAAEALKVERDDDPEVEQIFNEVMRRAETLLREMLGFDMPDFYYFVDHSPTQSVRDVLIPKMNIELEKAFEKAKKRTEKLTRRANNVALPHPDDVVIEPLHEVIARVRLNPEFDTLGELAAWRQENAPASETESEVEAAAEEAVVEDEPKRKRGSKIRSFFKPVKSFFKNLFKSKKSKAPKSNAQVEVLKKPSLLDHAKYKATCSMQEAHQELMRCEYAKEYDSERLTRSIHFAAESKFDEKMIPEIVRVLEKEIEELKEPIFGLTHATRMRLIDMRKLKIDCLVNPKGMKVRRPQMPEVKKEPSELELLRDEGERLIRQNYDRKAEVVCQQNYLPYGNE